MAQEGRYRKQKGLTLSEDAERRIDELAAKHYDAPQARIVEAALLAFERMAAVAQANAMREVDPNYGRGPGAVLALLRERGPMTRGEVAEATGIDQGTANSILSRLAAKKLVVREDVYGGRFSVVAPPAKRKRPG